MEKKQNEEDSRFRMMTSPLNDKPIGPEGLQAVKRQSSMSPTFKIEGNVPLALKMGQVASSMPQSTSNPPGKSVRMGCKPGLVEKILTKLGNCCPEHPIRLKIQDKGKLSLWGQDHPRTTNSDSTCQSPSSEKYVPKYYLTVGISSRRDVCSVCMR